MKSEDFIGSSSLSHPALCAKTLYHAKPSLPCSGAEWLCLRRRLLREKLGTSVIPSHMEALSRNRACVRGRTRRRPALSREQPVDKQVQIYDDDIGKFGSERGARVAIALASRSPTSGGVNGLI
jgi:hypothetical protein